MQVMSISRELNSMLVKCRSSRFLQYGIFISSFAKINFQKVYKIRTLHHWLQVPRLYLALQDLAIRLHWRCLSTILFRGLWWSFLKTKGTLVSLKLPSTEEGLSDISSPLGRRVKTPCIHLYVCCHSITLSLFRFHNHPFFACSENASLKCRDSERSKITWLTTARSIWLQNSPLGLKRTT